MEERGSREGGGGRGGWTKGRGGCGPSHTCSIFPIPRRHRALCLLCHLVLHPSLTYTSARRQPRRRRARREATRRARWRRRGGMQRKRREDQRCRYPLQRISLTPLFLSPRHPPPFRVSPRRAPRPCHHHHHHHHHCHPHYHGSRYWRCFSRSGTRRRMRRMRRRSTVSSGRKKEEGGNRK